jgi:hypothetical protein
MRQQPQNPIDQLSAAILHYQLGQPSIFLLELLKPITGISSATATVLEPLAKMLRLDTQLSMLSSVLSDRMQIERLICAVEKSLTDTNSLENTENS